MKNLSIVELYLIKKRLINEGMQNDPLMDEILDAIDEKSQMILEDTSATGGPCVSGGMGAVVSAQPSGLAGTTIGPGWASGGGTTGSGDISMPYNPGGTNRVFQKAPAQMGSNHGSRTGKKSRKKRMTMKTLQQLKNSFSKKQDYTKGGEKKSRVMDFNDFQKTDTTRVKKD